MLREKEIWPVLSDFRCFRDIIPLIGKLDKLREVFFIPPSIQIIFIKFKLFKSHIDFMGTQMK